MKYSNEWIQWIRPQMEQPQSDLARFVHVFSPIVHSSLNNQLFFSLVKLKLKSKRKKLCLQPKKWLSLCIVIIQRMVLQTNIKVCLIQWL